MTVCYFCFTGLVVFSPDPDPKLCSSAGVVKFQNVCLSRCHKSSTKETLLNSVKNLTAQKEVRPIRIEESNWKANTSEVNKRSSNFSLQEKLDIADREYLFNSSTFDFHVGAILKTLDKVNSLSSIQAVFLGENDVGKFCVLQIFGAPCVKTLIDHKKLSTTNCGRKKNLVDNILSRVSTALAVYHRSQKVVDETKSSARKSC